MASAISSAGVNVEKSLSGLSSRISGVTIAPTTTMFAVAPVFLKRSASASVQKGIISQDQLNIALIEQKKRKAPLGKVLVTLGFVTEATIRDILSETLGQVAIDLANTVVDPAAIALVPKDMARRYHVLPVSYDAEKKLLLIAVSDPANVVALDQIRALAREDLRIVQVLARESDITIGIEHHYGFELSVDGILHEIETGEIDYQRSPPTSTSTASPWCGWSTRC